MNSEKMRGLIDLLEFEKQVIANDYHDFDDYVEVLGKFGIIATHTDIVAPEALAVFDIKSPLPTVGKKFEITASSYEDFQYYSDVLQKFGIYTTFTETISEDFSAIFTVTKVQIRI